MKRFPFLLLDAGPIIKLFQLEIWDEFITKCDVAISRTVAEEAKYASLEFKDICINLDIYEEQNLVKIIDVELSNIKAFHEKFDQQYNISIHAGEKETLAFLCNSSDDWLVCSADHVVYRVLGLLGRSEQGISLEEILKQIGFSRELELIYTKKFREENTRIGQIHSIQNKGLL